MAKKKNDAAAKKQQATKAVGYGTSHQLLYSVALIVISVALTYLFTSSAGAPQAPPEIKLPQRVMHKVPGSEKPPVKKEIKPAVTEDPSCPGWVTDGECDNNPSFMLEHCPKSCESRATSPQKLRLQETRPKKKSDDKYPECAAWAASGECDINPNFMLKGLHGVVTPVSIVV